MNLINLSIIACLISFFVSCTVIRPGEVGVKQKFGKLSERVNTQGVVWYNPFTSKIIKSSVQTTNLELALTLPSKEGLSVSAQISILYKIKQDMVPRLIKDFGLNYEAIITNVFRSASAHVCSQHFAKDLHSGMRAEIETAIKDRMSETLKKEGIEIDAVLLKSIQLPPGLASSIEQKLQAEQEVMRMEFILKQAKLEADRKIIEAKGISGIEAFSELSKSPSTKIIITDGKSPMLINGEAK
jgi:prohibitin 1